jgi:ribosomal protein S18 acetylase RimI-like enzyme
MPVQTKRAQTMPAQPAMHAQATQVSARVAQSIPSRAPTPFVIRDAVRTDIASIMRLKLELAISDGIEHTVRATAADWERDAFGHEPRFTIFVADCGGRVIGIAICADRYFPGWVGATIILLDFCVEEWFRGQGVGTALLARVAAYAKARNSVMVELTMRADNRAASLYVRSGFNEVPQIRNYVIAGTALDDLAAADAPV